ncbi:MAG: Mov34/MPN/PAD-1 family protein [Trichodesmium sp. MAG_R04]|nr:Mov34/MPN/PAD-1 family protein [Trichodesmium sp. MAG_R04]
MVDLPPIDQDNSSSNQNSEPNKIVWVESEDVYKPIRKLIKDFKSERGITNTKKERVYITEIALQNLREHLCSNITVEQGGILFGNAYVDPQYTVYVEIKSAVAAPSTIGTGAHLEFTSASWQGIMDYAKITHPQENIVGWYHSHPNLGVFMSGTDMNTQRAFFYHPWCVSIVYDPVRDDIAYFLGANARRVNVV